MADEQQQEPLLSTGLLRGILLLGFLGAAGYVAYKFWWSQKSKEPAVVPVKTLTVPITLPTIKKAPVKPKKKK